MLDRTVSPEPLPTPVWSLPPPRDRAALPRRADVVVVGGGITGVSLLHWFAVRGVRAVVLERRQLAAGASGRNAGFLLTGVAANYAMAVRRYGRDVAREVWQFTADNHTLLAELVGGRAGYARRGSLTLAASAEEAELLRESHALLHDDRLPGRWSSGGTGDTDAHGGLINDSDGEIHPARAVGAIADLVDAATIHEAVDVLSMEPGSTEVRVHTGDGEVLAGVVVLATNAETASLAPAVPIVPIRGQMLATAPADVRVAQRPTYSHWGYRYWRQRDDGRVLVGGWRDEALSEEVGTEAVANPRVQVHLDAHLAELGVTAEVTHRWAGIMGFSPDELPLVGAVADMANVHVCGGYTGHGMGFAVNAARHLVAHLLDGGALPTWMSADRATATPAASST